MGIKDKIELDMENIPKHIAIIMDGNGRWAKKKRLMKKLGHKAGANVLEKITDVASNLGVMHITAYAFSTENWKRSEEEIAGIMDLLRHYLKDHIRNARKRSMKIDVIGDVTRLDEDIQQQILTLKELTKDKPGINLHIALNYGGRNEILRAIKKIAQKSKDGEIAPEDITEDYISSHLDTADVPDPELVIRTSGEERISNFLLWQIAYSEFNFSDKLWPDYTGEDLKQAIWEYQNRDRRFGGRNS